MQLNACLGVSGCRLLNTRKGGAPGRGWAHTLRAKLARLLRQARGTLTQASRLALGQPCSSEANW
eukprot:1921416-Alexandrium_andersonii.AAC.1